MMQGDQTVLNPFNALFYANAEITPAIYTSATYPATERHEILYAQDAAGDLVRGHVAEFLATGSASIGEIALP
jgi:hypothetical protein